MLMMANHGSTDVGNESKREREREKRGQAGPLAIPKMQPADRASACQSQDATESIKPGMP